MEVVIFKFHIIVGNGNFYLLITCDSSNAGPVVGFLFIIEEKHESLYYLCDPGSRIKTGLEFSGCTVDSTPSFTQFAKKVSYPHRGSTSDGYPTVDCTAGSIQSS